MTISDLCFITAQQLHRGSGACSAATLSGTLSSAPADGRGRAVQQQQSMRRGGGLAEAPSASLGRSTQAGLAEAPSSPLGRSVQGLSDHSLVKHAFNGM